MEKFAGLDLDARARMKSGTKGHNVNDFVCSYVADALQGLPQIECCERLNFFKLIIRDEVVIRFKRLQNDLLARSAPSDQAKAWFSNSPIRESRIIGYVAILDTFRNLPGRRV